METCLCKVKELKRGRATPVRVGLKRLAVWTDGEDIVVFEPFCPHARANLLHGTYQGATVTCHWHGLQFDLRSGRGLNNDSCLRIHDSEVREGRVYVRMPHGEPRPDEEQDAEPDRWMPDIRWKKGSD